MTQSSPQPAEPPVDPDGAKTVDGATTAAGPTGAAAGRRGRLVRLTREGRTRWVALGAVVVIGGGLAAVAAAEHGHGDHMRGGFAAKARAHGPGEERAEGWAGPLPHRGGEPEVVDGDRDLPGGKGAMGRGPGGGRVGGSAKGAPVPLPALAAAQAVEKATAAVEGGKVESLRAVAQQGGGSAWLAVVLGTDGVRHAVTLAGADGAVTGNTVLGQGPAGPR
ncbi:hypothetical protein K7B10_34810 [Streptomyces flavotricini]|uniref:PepSY domain-containing protein n=1 Tax=Streptomyces flavotricini TaxID=66888 RepID=A0ABS8EFD6_9ACTN|nr:hypothetical protein [Streptomyces flavotricini]MCC0099866.1 hypothetical protein [Streptomyces flavotricini]